MTYLISFLRIVHITCGTIALIMAPLALATVKGGAAHRRWGKIYFWSMAVVAVTGLVTALYRPIVFLALVAVFSFYAAYSAYRVLYMKRPEKGDGPKWFDWTFAITTWLVGMGLIYMVLVRPSEVWRELGVVSIVFGMLATLL